LATQTRANKRNFSARLDIESVEKCHCHDYRCGDQPARNPYQENTRSLSHPLLPATGRAANLRFLSTTAPSRLRNDTG
jgi:hypothetical protein